MNPIRLRGIPEGAAIRLQSVGGSPLRLRAVSSLRGPKGDPGTSVPSVFGRVGAILAQADDYTADQIDNDSSVTGDTVKDALEYLAANGGSVDSVNGQTGTVVLDPDDLDDTSTTNKFTDAADISKLAGIEALADVTDAGNVGSTIHSATGKTTPVDADELALIDSAASNVLKKVTWANIKATLKTYFDTLYIAITLLTTRGDIITRGASAPQRVALGTVGQVLKSDGTDAVWASFLRGSFSANKNGTNQTGILDSTMTKLTFGTEEYDNGSYYDAANSKWTPPAGLVLIQLKFRASANMTANSGVASASIWKNGSEFKTIGVMPTFASNADTSVMAFDVANGTDYYEGYAYLAGGVNTSDKTVNGTAAIGWFAGVTLS